jgi:hypothetical protein
MKWVRLTPAFFAGLLIKKVTKASIHGKKTTRFQWVFAWSGGEITEFCGALMKAGLNPEENATVT